MAGLLVLTNLNCASQKKIESTDKPEGPQANLTLAQAELRFSQVKDVSYKMHFDMNATEESYGGQVEISLTALKTDSPFRIDYSNGQVKELSLNSRTQKYTYNGKFIELPAGALTPGANKITIQFVSPLTKEARGISRFVDPEDKNVYLHTQLEPYEANRVFPCLDQPDLKATYEMTVRAPKSWTVVTSVRESNTKSDGDFRLWTFPRSERFSTYIWSLHAGPFKIWEKNFRIPLRLMARQSLAKYVNTEEWFPVTQQGFDFFEKYFAYDYPYKKYDQLIIPEFGSGAMENVAAVTFSERFISRGQKSIEHKRDLADVILHEMAHMWFGDLVTMKWWNDLWLNESFATYMSHVAMVGNTRYKEGWRDFYGTKTWAYWEDDLVTTHPIEAVVPDTMQAMANFDGITYGKGASVLKQLAFYLTPEKFQKGTQIYFKKYAGTNTRLDDFMGALSEASGKDLTSWKEIWLRTAGVNTIEPQIQCNQGKVTGLELLQTASADHPYLRNQKSLVAFLYLKNGSLSVGKTLPVEINGETTQVPEANGTACPLVVYPNFEDHGYMLALLDSTSLENFKKHGLTVHDPFLRQMLWKAVSDLTRTAKMPLQDYVQLLQQGLQSEKDDFILRDLLWSLHGYGRNISSVLFYLSRGTTAEYMKQTRQFEEILWDRLTKAAPGSEQQKVMFNGMVNSARTSFGYDRLLSVLEGKTKLKGFVFDQDYRWAVIRVLATANHPKASEFIAAEEGKDKSFFGVQGAIASKVSLPRWEEKQKWIDDFKVKDSDKGIGQFRAALRNVFPFGQDNFREKYSQQFFQDLALINKTKEGHIASMFVALAPIDCGVGTDRIGPFLSEQTDLQPPVAKNLKIFRQENQRCQKIIESIR